LEKSAAGRAYARNIQLVWLAFARRNSDAFDLLMFTVLTPEMAFDMAEESSQSQP
jgi:hypothetical protein